MTPSAQDPSIRPALERLPDSIKLLHGVVSGLEKMLLLAESLSDARVQRAIPFLGLVWLYAAAIRDLLHSKREDGQVLWNAPALAALCRPLQESFLSFYYFAIEEPEGEEAEFRSLLLVRHQAFKRWDLLRCSDPSNPLIAAEQRQSKQDYDQSHLRLIEHPFMAQLDKKVADGLRSRPDQYIAAPLHDVWDRSGMPPEMYGVLFRYFSQYVHATPYAVSSLSCLQGHP